MSLGYRDPLSRAWAAASVFSSAAVFMTAHPLAFSGLQSDLSQRHGAWSCFGTQNRPTHTHIGVSEQDTSACHGRKEVPLHPYHVTMGQCLSFPSYTVGLAVGERS